MTARTFCSAVPAGRTVVYDPAAELAHLAPRTLPVGRVLLDDTEVAQWPTVSQSQLATRVPLNICWSPLVRCNLHCPHCLDDKTLPEAGAAERARAGEILAASGALGLDISGGEPLLLRELAHLLDILARHGAAVSCTTNGWHLQRRAAELAPHLAAIRVSLDGPDAPAHDHWRGAGSFARAREGIQAAVAEGIPLQIHAVVMRSTLDRVQSMVDLAAELGAVGVTFLQMLPIGDGARLARSEMVTDTEAARAISTIHAPEGVHVRLRTRESAEGFTVVRADGLVYRNGPAVARIIPSIRLRTAGDLLLPTPHADRSTP
ncbi:radical SAM protein [Streptomyces sp. NPDC048172]|uniref:radical SAM protein n=1 Tax=Streptomyces sp. NPDC048172 TaxID=3365505 RepID=UPI003715287A